MSGPLCLSGSVQQVTAAPLRDQALACVAGGALVVTATDLKSIDFGPAQVLLSAARVARTAGLPCTIDTEVQAALDRTLTAAFLPPAARFFDIAPATEKPN